MDCEKFENLLIDELYGELDEVTSAAVRRHAAGCARCGALLSGLRATRKVATLPALEPSSDLEDRILSAVREQQKVLPFRARFAVGLSRAGAWAMRPQTAMAAVFLVVIGTSFVLVQSRKTRSPAASIANAEGAPVAAAASAAPGTASAYALDGKEAAFAHGVEEKTLATSTPATLAMNSVATADEAKDKYKQQSAEVFGNGRERGAASGVGGGGAASDVVSVPNAAMRTMAAGAVTKPDAQGQAHDAAPSFDAAKRAYDARRFDDARTEFDSLAPSDANAALWAGRAEKAKNGCSAAAVQRFESARTRAPSGSAVANDATLEAALCYRAAGNTALARARLSKLIDQPGYGPAAQNQLDQLSPSAAAHEARRPATRAAPQVTAAPAQKRAGY